MPNPVRHRRMEQLMNDSELLIVLARVTARLADFQGKGVPPTTTKLARKRDKQYEDDVRKLSEFADDSLGGSE